MSNLGIVPPPGPRAISEPERVDGDITVNIRQISDNAVLQLASTRGLGEEVYEEILDRNLENVTILLALAKNPAIAPSVRDFLIDHLLEEIRLAALETHLHELDLTVLRAFLLTTPKAWQILTASNKPELIREILEGVMGEPILKDFCNKAMELMHNPLLTAGQIKMIYKRVKADFCAEPHCMNLMAAIAKYGNTPADILTELYAHPGLLHSWKKQVTHAVAKHANTPPHILAAITGYSSPGTFNFTGHRNHPAAFLHAKLPPQLLEEQLQVAEKGINPRGWHQDYRGKEIIELTGKNYLEGGRDFSDEYPTFNPQFTGKQLARILTVAKAVHAGIDSRKTPDTERASRIMALKIAKIAICRHGNTDESLILEVLDDDVLDDDGMRAALESKSASTAIARAAFFTKNGNPWLLVSNGHYVENSKSFKILLQSDFVPREVLAAIVKEIACDKLLTLKVALAGGEVRLWKVLSRHPRSDDKLRTDLKNRLEIYQPGDNDSRVIDMKMQRFLALREL